MQLPHAKPLGAETIWEECESNGQGCMGRTQIPIVFRDTKERVSTPGFPVSIGNGAYRLRIFW